MNVRNLIDRVATGSYLAKIYEHMDYIDYRRITLSEDLIQISDLRQKSYASANIYSDNNQKMLDSFDFDPDTYVFGVYYREIIVSTVRIHILNSVIRNSNSIKYFPNILNPLLDQGMSFMDPTRFAIDPQVDAEIPGLPLITLRLGFMAAKHFNCDYCISMIKEGHAAFYRRFFQSSQIAPYTQFPAFTAKYALFSSPKSMEETICNRYPIFRSLAKEREMLFDKPKPGYPANLSVKPTARIAIQIQNQRHVGNMAS